MYKIYNTPIDSNKMQEIKEFKKGSWINMVSPTEEEIKEVSSELKISEKFIRYALDTEEKSRIDIEEDDNTILFLVDTPLKEENNIYSTFPLGMIVVRDDFIITVSLKVNDIIDLLKRSKVTVTYKKTRFILQIYYLISTQFLNLLYRMNKEINEAEMVLKKSMKNKELFKLMDFGKTFIYFTTSLKANQRVMERTLRGKVIKLYDEDEDLLEDAIVETKQAVEMSEIYSNILSNTLDAYASIISNNVNEVMKVLASVTIIVSIPTLITSFFGMNVRLPFGANPMGSLWVFLIAVIGSVAVAVTLYKKNLLK